MTKDDEPIDLEIERWIGVDVRNNNQRLFDTLAPYCSTPRDLLRKMIAALGITPKVLASRMGVTRAYIYMLMSENTGYYIGKEACHKLSKVLEIDPKKLFMLCAGYAMDKYLVTHD